MASVQVGGGSSPSVVPALRTAVLVRTRWTSPWLHVPYLIAEEAVETAAGDAISKASIRWDVGRMKTHDATNFTTYHPANLQERFIRILVSTQVGTFTAFTGIVANERYADYAIKSGEAYGTDLFEAQGLEYLLRRGRIQGSYVETGLFVERTMVFNESQDHGLGLVGNRSTAVGPDGVHVFSRDGAVWSHLDILRYALWYYQPSGVPFQLTGALAPLAEMYGRYDLFGRDLFEVLNLLVDRHRGLGWKVEVSGNVAHIVVFTVTATAINVGTFTLPANPQQILIGPLGNHTMSPSVELSTVHRVRRVIVIGAPIKVMLSLAFTNGSLEEGWTAAQQTAYLAADDAERATDKYRRVFRFFRIPLDWDWTYNRLDGGGSAIANPAHSDDGYLLPAVQGAFINMLDKRLEHDLPLFEDTGADPDDLKPRPLFVLVENPDDPDTYVYVEGLDAIGYSNHDVSVPARGMGFDVKGPQNHTLGLGVFEEEGGVFDVHTKAPEVDYRTMIATVFVATDVHLKVVALIPGNENSELGRDLVIEKPSSELWYAAPGTVSDVNEGALVYHNGGTGEILRDDGDELRWIAAAAKAWYGQQRNKFELRFKGMLSGFSVGTLVRAASRGAIGFEPIGTVVTERRFQFTEGMVEVKTGYAELDVAGLRG